MGQMPQPAGVSKVKGLDVIFPRPEVIDRQAYAPGIKVSKDLDLLYFSALTPYPPEVDPWDPGEFKRAEDPMERSRMPPANLDRLLKAAGATWEHVINNVNYTAA